MIIFIGLSPDACPRSFKGFKDFKDLKALKALPKKFTLLPLTKNASGKR